MCVYAFKFIRIRLSVCMCVFKFIYLRLCVCMRACTELQFIYHAPTTASAAHARVCPLNAQCRYMYSAYNIYTPCSFLTVTGWLVNFACTFGGSSEERRRGKEPPNFFIRLDVLLSFISVRTLKPLGMTFYCSRIISGDRMLNI